jgi:hypothetical protein
MRTFDRRHLISSCGTLFAVPLLGGFWLKRRKIAVPPQLTQQLNKDIVDRANERLAKVIGLIVGRSGKLRDIVAASREIKMVGRHMMETDFDGAFRLASEKTAISDLHFSAPRYSEITFQFLKRYSPTMTARIVAISELLSNIELEELKEDFKISGIGTRLIDAAHAMRTITCDPKVVEARLMASNKKAVNRLGMYPLDLVGSASGSDVASNIMLRPADIRLGRALPLAAKIVPGCSLSIIGREQTVASVLVFLDLVRLIVTGECQTGKIFQSA